MYVCDAHYNADHQEWWSNQTYSHDVSSYIIMHYLIMCCPLAGCNLFSIVSCSFNSTAACCQFTKAHGAKLKVQAPSWHSWTWAVIGRCPVRPIFCGAFTYDFGQLSAAESSAQMSKCILVAAHLQRKPCTCFSSKSLISFSVQPSCGPTWSHPTWSHPTISGVGVDGGLRNLDFQWHGRATWLAAIMPIFLLGLGQKCRWQVTK